MPSPASRSKKQRLALFQRIQDAAAEYASGTVPDDLAGLRRDVAALSPEEMESQVAKIAAEVGPEKWAVIGPEIGAFLKSAGFDLDALKRPPAPPLLPNPDFSFVILSENEINRRILADSGTANETTAPASTETGTSNPGSSGYE